MKTTRALMLTMFAFGCEPDSTDTDADTGVDSQVDDDSNTDMGADTDLDTELDTDADTAPVTRTTLFPAFCPSTPTAPGAYQGTLASNTNDLASADCIGATPGRDGAVRVELEPGETLSATYNSTSGNAILYILDACPVVTSCLDGSDASVSDAESVLWTNDGDATNAVYLILDNAELATSGAFILDFDISIEE